MNAIEIKDLSKSFRGMYAVDHLDAMYLCISVAAKNRTWLSMVGSFVVCMFMFMMVPMITPLNATVLHVILALAGAVIFGVIFGALSNVILKKTSLV